MKIMGIQPWAEDIRPWSDEYLAYALKQNTKKYGKHSLETRMIAEEIHRRARDAAKKLVAEENPVSTNRG